MFINEVVEFAVQVAKNGIESSALDLKSKSESTIETEDKFSTVEISTMQTSSIKTLKKSDIKMQIHKSNQSIQKTKSSSTSKIKLKMAVSPPRKN